MRDMGLLLVHIGMGKAASTTIQRSVLSHVTAPLSIGRHKRNHNIESAFGRMWWRVLMSPDSVLSDPVRELIENQYLNAEELVVLTDEVISASPVMVDNLLANLSKFGWKTKFLVVIREQTSFLQSLYNHSMRARVNAFGLPLLHSELSNRLFYKGDIDVWVDDLITARTKGDRNILESLDYEKLIRRIQQAVGEEGLVAIPFELLITDRVEFSRNIANLFNMESAVVEHCFGEKTNFSGGRLRDYRLGKVVETVMGHSIRHQVKKIGLTRQGVSNALVPILSRLKLEKISHFGGPQKKTISEEFRESNQALNEMLPYDLQALGYLPN